MSEMAMPELLIVAEAGELIAVVRRHQDITDVFRLMKDRLQLTNEFCDDAGGLTKGHTDKILGPSESKSWGPTTFDLFCEMFAIEFRVHIDLDAARRMEAIWEGRERPLYPNAKVARISKKLIERAKPHVIKDMGRAGAAKRMTVLTAEHRSKIARKAAKSRWRKHRHKAARLKRPGQEEPKTRSATIACGSIPGPKASRPPRLEPAQPGFPAPNAAQAAGTRRRA